MVRGSTTVSILTEIKQSWGLGGGKQSALRYIVRRVERGLKGQRTRKVGGVRLGEVRGLRIGSRSASAP